MKTTKILLIVSLVLSACAMRQPDEAAGNGSGSGSGSGSDSGSGSGTTGCHSASDCNDNVACTTGVCQTDGKCRYDSTCLSGQVCDVQSDACETPSTTSMGHAISCFQTGSTLYVTVTGKLTDAVYGGSLANPAYVSVASDQIANSWNLTSSASGPRVDLSSNETSGGYVSSGSINLPSDQAQRFTLLVWSNDSGGYARRLDLSKWDVLGDGCARIADGTTGGVTDGYVIGRAPLCPNACDDGDALTFDSCQATVNPAANNGCWHGGSGTTTTGSGEIQCRRVAVNNVEKLEVTLMPNANGLLSGTVSESTSLPSPEFVEVGEGHLGWPSTQGRQIWITDTTVYRFYHDPNPSNFNDFNYFVADNDDGADSVAGGDYVDLSRWIITNPAPANGSPYPAANCHVVGGGISIN